MAGQNVRLKRFKLNKKGIAACAVGDELADAVSDIAHKAIGYAQLISPDDSTEYQRSFRVHVHIVPDITYRVRGEPMARWSAEIANNAHSAIIVEVGAQNTPDYRVLGRTLEWIELTADD